MIMNRFARCIMIGLMLLLAFGPTATASAGGKPVRIRIPFGPPSTVSGVCEFDVTWEALSDNMYLTIFTEEDATRFLITGVLMSRFTNVITGKSVDLNTSAQMTQVVYNDGYFESTLEGPFIGAWDFPGNPPFAYVKGRQFERYDPEGNLIKATQSGQVQDVCAMLSN